MSRTKNLNLIDTGRDMHEALTEFTNSFKSIRIKHLCKAQTGSPDCPSTLLMLVAAPDELIQPLREEVELAARSVFREHGIESVGESRIEGKQ